jgi:serine/threonine protein kinase/tetratricopeptide (TPR) repeat protein
MARWGTECLGDRGQVQPENTTHKDVKQCVTCGGRYGEDEVVCPKDGGILIAAKHEPVVGSIIEEKYEILEVLGGGGMGVVYKAKHLLMHRTVAIKMLLPEVVSSEIALARFQQEAQAASSLSHPNILAVFDFGQTADGKPYLVMDFLEGKSLSQILEDDCYLPLQRAVPIFIQICAGLAHAHQKGVIHRDLKPANIMLVDFEGTGDFVKIVDFGIAKLLPRQDGDGKPMELTHTGQIFGSPLYMSPEQCRGTGLDARSDIYSLGCVMYRIVAGESPFMGQDALEAMFKQVNDNPRSFATCCPEMSIPESFESIVMKMLSKDPADRYQSMLEVRKALEETAGMNVVSPFIFPANEENASRTPKIGELDGERAALNILMQRETVLVKDQAGSNVAAAGANATGAANAASGTDAGSAAAGSTAAAGSGVPRGGASSAEQALLSQTINPSSPESADKLKPAFIAAGALLFVGLAVIVAQQLGSPTKHSGATTVSSGARTQNGQVGQAGQSGQVVQGGRVDIGEVMKQAQDFYNKGEYKNAEDLLTPALNKALGAGDMADSFMIRSMLGRICLSEFKLDMARSYLYSIVSYDGTGTKPTDSEMAEALNNLAVIYTQAGQYAKAQSYFKRALTLKNKMDPQHANVAGTLSGMGNMELRQGHYKEALNYLLKAKTLTMATNGADHPDTAKIINDLGQAYQLLGKLPEADAAYKQAYAIRQKSLSPGDPAIADSQMVMGALAFRKGDYATSEQLFKAALAIDEKALGPENQVVGEIYFVLGVLYDKQRMFDKAVDNYRKALAIRTKVLDPGDVKIKRTRDLLQAAEKKLKGRR